MASNGANRLLVLTFHIVVLLYNVAFIIVDEFKFYQNYNLYSEKNTVEKLEKHPLYSFPYMWKFYTRWCQILVVFSYGLMFSLNLQRVRTHFNESHRLVQVLQTIVDVLVTSVIFPMAYVVGTVFWLWYIKNGGYLDEYGIGVDTSFINLLNRHNKHTMPMVILTLELLFVRHSMPSYCKGLMCSLLPVLTFTIFLSILGFNKGVWIYSPIYESKLLGILLSIAAITLTFTFYNLTCLMKLVFDYRQCRIV